MLCFEAHYRLVTIHPWVDGNGRTTRLLMNMIQYRFGLPQSRVLPKDKVRYIQALVDAREADDCRKFIDVMKSLHVADLQTQLAVYLKDTKDDRITIEDDRIKSARDRINDRINDRIKGPIKASLIKLCDWILVHPTATAKDIADHLGLSEPTVNRYIRVLRDHKIIARVGARKNGHWIIVPE